MTLESWLLFISTAVFLCYAPGANNLMAMTNGLRFGMGPSIAAGLGRLVAFAVMIVITALGLGALLAASELAFHVIKWAGAAYLLYLGFQIWRGPRIGLPDQPETDGKAKWQPQTYSLWDLTKKEFLVAMGNPKAILIFTAFFPQFLDPSQPQAMQFAIMGQTFLIIELVALVSYVILGKGLTRLRLKPGSRLMNRLSGGIMMGAGALLAAARRA
ncbi:LysE family translocator [Rhodovibrionaceae bacterium A322]